MCPDLHYSISGQWECSPCPISHKLQQYIQHQKQQQQQNEERPSQDQQQNGDTDQLIGALIAREKENNLNQKAIPCQHARSCCFQNQENLNFNIEM